MGRAASTGPPRRRWGPPRRRWGPPRRRWACRLWPEWGRDLRRAPRAAALLSSVRWRGRRPPPMRRSRSFGRAGWGRRRHAVWFGAQLAAQPARREAGRTLPALLHEIGGALGAHAAAERAAALSEAPAESKLLKKLRSRLEAGEPVSAVLRGITPASLVGLLHAWIEAVPGGLCAPAQADIDVLIVATDLTDFSPPALLKSLSEDAREVVLWLLDLLAEAARAKAEPAPLVAPTPPPNEEALETLAAVFGSRLLGRPSNGHITVPAAAERGYQRLLLQLLRWRLNSPTDYIPSFNSHTQSEAPSNGPLRVSTPTVEVDVAPGPPSRSGSLAASPAPKRSMSWGLRGRWRAILNDGSGQPQTPRAIASSEEITSSPTATPQLRRPPATSSTKAVANARWFGAKLASQTSEHDGKQWSRRVPRLLVAIRAELQSQQPLMDTTIALGVPRGTEAQEVAAMRAALEGGAAPTRALQGASAAALTQLLIEWIDELPDDLFASCRPALLQLMKWPAPAEDHSELLLLTRLPTRERELVLWMLQLLHAASPIYSTGSGRSQRLATLSAICRQLAPRLLSSRAGTGEKVPADSPSRGGRSKAERASLSTDRWEFDPAYVDLSFRYLERLLHAFSLLVIDSLLAPPSLAVLSNAFPLQLQVLLPARTTRAQAVARLASGALEIEGGKNVRATLEERLLPSPSTGAELLRLLRDGPGKFAKGKSEDNLGHAWTVHELFPINDEQVRAMVEDLQSGRLALMQMGEEVVPSRSRLRISVSWPAEHAWQSQVLLETHESCGGGGARPKCGEIMVPTLHAETVQASLTRGLRELGIDARDLRMQSRVEKEVLTVEQEERYGDYPVMCVTRTVRGVLSANASAAIMRPTFSSSPQLPGEARRWLAWAHPSELAGALHSRLCLAAEEARREAGIREWELLLQRSRQAGGEGARVACVCVGRMQEAVTPKMEAAVSEACSRLTSGSREIWDIAMVKYRTIANLPLGGRLLLINAIAPDGSCLPPFFCLLPRGALDGYASPARASANTSRQQLAVVLGSNVPRPLLHDDSMASALAAAASAGAAAVAMVAAMSATELIELPGGCWGGSELRAADAVLANTLAELLSHESVECRARGSGDSPPPSPTSVEAAASTEIFGDAGLVLDDLLGGALQRLQQRSAVLTKCSLFEVYKLQPRLRALLSSRTPIEVASSSLEASCNGLIDSFASVSPGWPLPPNTMGWASLQHGDLQAGHVLIDSRQHYWLLRSHRVGPGHALQDVAKLCASTLFLGTALPLSLADLQAPPARQLAAQLGIGEADAHAVQGMASRRNSVDALRDAIRNCGLPAAAKQRVLRRIGTDDERATALAQAKLLIDWVGSMRPFGSHVYDLPLPSGVKLPQIALAFSYLQQFWHAAASLCCPPGNATAAHSLQQGGSSSARQLAETLSLSESSTVSSELSSRRAAAAAATALEEAWRHPAQLVIPLLAYAARMARYFEASAPQREWMLYAVGRLCDSLRVQVSSSSYHRVPVGLAPRNGREMELKARDGYGGSQTSCPYACGQRLLVLRPNLEAVGIEGGTTTLSGMPLHGEGGLAQVWMEGEVDETGALRLHNSTSSPLALNSLSTDFWPAPASYRYASGDRVLLLTERGWDEWSVHKHVESDLCANLYEVRRAASGWTGEADSRCVILTPYNHRRAGGGQPTSEVSYVYEADQLVRAMHVGRWVRALSTGATGGGECQVKLAVGESWATMPLSALGGHAPLLNDQLDLDLEHAKYCHAVLSEGTLPWGAVLPALLSRMHLDGFALAFCLAPAPDGSRPHSPRAPPTPPSDANLGSQQLLDLPTLLSRMLRTEQPPSPTSLTNGGGVLVPRRAVLVVGARGSGKSLLCRAAVSHVLRAGGEERTVPVLVPAWEVAEAVSRGALRQGEAGGLVLQWLRLVHGPNSRRFLLIKQALLEQRLLLLLDGLSLPLRRVTTANSPRLEAMRTLQQEASGLLASTCTLLVTARPGAFDPAFFPPSSFSRLELSPQPRALLAATSAGLRTSQRTALRLCCESKWGAEALRRPLVSMLLVAVHSRRPAGAPPLSLMGFLVAAIRHMLHEAEAAHVHSASDENRRGASSPRSSQATATTVPLRLHVLKSVALAAFERRERVISAHTAETALGHSPGALMLWRQMQLEGTRSQLPLLEAELEDGDSQGGFSFGDSLFADALTALALCDLSTGALARESTALALTTPAERIKSAANPANGTKDAKSPGKTPPGQWAWPEGRCSCLLRGGASGSDALLLAEEHMDPRSNAGAQWLRHFTDAIAGEAVRAHSIADLEVRKVAVLIRHSYSMRALQLVKCGLDDDAAEALGHAFEEASDELALEAVDLSGNMIGPKGAAALVRTLPDSVRHLGVHSNRIGDEGALAFSKLLRGTYSLFSLDLSANHIGETGVMRLIDALTSNNTLQRLYLRGNTSALQAPALEPRHALLEGAAQPLKERVVLE